MDSVIDWIATLRRRTPDLRLLCLLAISWNACAGNYSYEVKPGDTLIGVSQLMLINPSAWTELQKINRIANTHRLKPGSKLDIPLEMIRSTQVNAQVTRIGSSVANTDSSLAEGGAIETAADDVAVLRFPDGSEMRVLPLTRARFETLREFPDGNYYSRLKLLGGRVEAVIKRLRGSRNEVVTPVGNLAVRGTRYRIASDSKSAEQRSEVTEGDIEVGGMAGAGPAKRIPAGSGAVVDAKGRVSAPIVLLAPPQLDSVASLFERPLMKFSFPAIRGASCYRAQIADDADFRQIRRDLVSDQPQFKLADLADGSYFLRVRAIDVHGLEGRDADKPIRLKARPEPPFLSSPPVNGITIGESAIFDWTENPDASQYRFQLARDAGFTDLVNDGETTLFAGNQVGKLTPRKYYWRVASVAGGGDRGPWSDTQSFTLKPPLGRPEPPKLSPRYVEFSWPGVTGQQFDFQLSRDQLFEHVILNRHVSEPTIVIDKPAAGEYYMRFRAIDPDGFATPYCLPQKFVVPACLMDSEGRCVNDAWNNSVGAG